MNAETIPLEFPRALTGWCASGSYRRSPLAGTLYKAELEYVPMSRPNEYAQGTLLEHASEAPVIVSPSQRYRILAALVTTLREHIPGLSCTLVRLYGPDFNVQLPADLLCPDVLLVHQPLEALQSVFAAGRQNVVVVQQDLRADGPERGGNTLSVSLLAPSNPRDAFERFWLFTQNSPFMQALDGLKIGPVNEGRA